MNLPFAPRQYDGVRIKAFPRLAAQCAALLLSGVPIPAFAFGVGNLPVKDTGAVPICDGQSAAAIALDPNDYPAVKLAAELFAADVQRVTGQRPAITDQTGVASIIVGTLGHSALVDTLVRERKLKGANQIKGRWEATLIEIVENPFSGVKRALVIAGSDRRGTAYGLMQLSEKIGVSPWYWWADAPVRRQNSMAIRVPAPEVNAPAVKYRGIFINDEDWGLYPWAKSTFDSEFKNIGPKTYEKVFELMLRLRLNYIWPAMHACSTEFGSVPENVALADKYGIVAGSSHCEPMLCNNIHWDQKTQGPWNYSTNRDTIRSYWEANAKARSTQEAVWGIGIRGIHDAGMQAPPKDMPGKLNLLGEIFNDQEALLNQYVTKRWGPVAQCFVPYKEVLPICLAWNPDGLKLGAQPDFLRAFAAGIVGEPNADQAANLLTELYRLGTIRKPELMQRAWALSLPEERVEPLRRDYENLLKNEEKLAASVPIAARDAYFELIGFPARILGGTGLIFMADRAVQFKDASREDEIKRVRAFLEKQVEQYNSGTAKGKWNHIMPGLVTGKYLTRWSSQVRWPWGEKAGTVPQQAPNQIRGIWRDAASADRQSGSGNARWMTVPGLGPTGRAVALKPASLQSTWKETDKSAPALEFTFEAKGGDGEALIDFLPTFRLCPGMKLQVAVTLDSQPPVLVEVPGSSGLEDENGPNRHEGIQNNYVRARLPFPKLPPGRHVLKISAVDPGVAIDRVSLPANN